MKIKQIIWEAFLIIGLLLLTIRINAADKNESKLLNENNASNQSVSTKKEYNILMKELTFKEKIKIIREIKKESKKARKNKMESTPMVILYILAIIIPPVAVGIYTDWGEPTLWNLLFTLLFWIPGIIHAFYILLR
jgi:uncharacterized membrane protein YqaE (UPF0057 family)